MKKITIIALHLGYGGIEKAITSLANMLCKDYEVTIISTYKLYDKPAFFIDKKVKVTYLINKKPNKKEWLDTIKKGRIFSLVKESVKSINILYLRKKMMINAIKELQSDVIISTRPLHNYMVGKYGKKGTLKIAWEHSHHNNNQKYINNLVKSCVNLDYLICVSKELTSFYSQKLPAKIKCIHISLSLDGYPDKLSLLDKKQITFIGRLSKVKGVIDLIDVFKLVNKIHPDWHLNIIGDGLEKDKINSRIKNYNLQNSIVMHSYKNKKEINKILNDSSVYVMTSLSESFGLVLIESMSFGIPCVAFDSARGSLEVIDNNVNGFIIKNRDKQKMADKIISLIENKDLRQTMGIAARKKSLLYATDKVMKEWIKVIEK